MPRSPERPPAAHLVVASCPELAPLADESFGATTRKLLEVAEAYWKCRAAAVAAAGGSIPGGGTTSRPD